MNKESTLIILDVGNSMYKTYNQSTQTRLEVAVDCTKLYLQQKVLQTKNHQAGLLLMATDESEDQTLLIQDPVKPTLELIRNIGQLPEHQASQYIGGDILDAIDKAIPILAQQGAKVEKRLFVFTAGEGPIMNGSEVKKISRCLTQNGIKVNFIALDFMTNYDMELDQEENQFYSNFVRKIMEGCPTQTDDQNENQRMVYQLKQELGDNMRIFSASLALELQSQMRIQPKMVRSHFRGEIEIGKLSFQISMYKKTAEERIPPLKRFSLISKFTKEIEGNQIVTQSSSYIQTDTGINDVQKEDHVKGYYYGKQLIPIDSMIEQTMVYHSQKCLRVIAFINKTEIKREHYMTAVDLVLATDNEQSQKGLAALIQALIATKKVAIARFVSRDNTSPKLVTLIPQKGKDYYGFWMVQLPTSEDVRDYQFSNLKKSTPIQQEAVSKMIDAMDLDNIKQNGEKVDIIKVKNLLNPTRQYFFQVMMHRAFNQENELPKPNAAIEEYLKPESKIWKNAQAQLAELNKVFKFKKIEIKKATTEKKVFWKQIIDQEKDRSTTAEQVEEEDIPANTKKFGFDKSDEILKQISTVNPIQDFKKMISERRVDLVDDALLQMKGIIYRLIDESVKGSYFQKAIDCLKEMRQGCITEDEPDVFNNFLYNIKDKYNKQEIWAIIIKEGISLINNNDNKKSKVTVQEAYNFLNEEHQHNEQKITQIQLQDEDMLRDIE